MHSPVDVLFEAARAFGEAPSQTHLDALIEAAVRYAEVSADHCDGASGDGLPRLADARLEVEIPNS